MQMPVLRKTFILSILALLYACTAASEPSGERPPREDTNSTAPAEAHTILPADLFLDACAATGAAESDRTCRRGTKLIAQLAQRRLGLPEPPRRCPASRGVIVRTDDFRVVALGINRPVQPGVATDDAEGLSHGRVAATRLPNGWLGFKTLWFARPRYQGPFLVRAGAVGGAGSIRFDRALERDMFAVRTGTANGTDGYREVPGGTYVSRPGCYAWQVDGEQFSYQIVFRVYEARRVR